VSADNPTAKFGEALRQQVEERLLFFDKGEPPSKNADAMRKVLDDIAAEMEIDEPEDEPVLPLLEPEPSPKKKDRKKRKRGDDDEMDVDEEDGEPTKKVKLTKEEKKALKKAAKKAAKVAAAEDGVVCGSFIPSFPADIPGF
jgi:nucleolar protein 56